VFKVAISDHRIVDADGGTVTFSYKKPKSRRTRYMKLDARDFMSRFLQHSLPSGFMKVRYYGFMHACSGVPLENVRASIEMIYAFDVAVSDPPRDVREKSGPSCPVPVVFVSKKMHPYPPFTLFRNLPEHLKFTTRRGSRTTSSPVAGFRPLRAFLSFTQNLPKSETRTSSPVSKDAFICSSRHSVISIDLLLGRPSSA
jgi:hypothetical protein